MGDAVSGENPCLACGACCAAFRVDFHPSEMAGGTFAYGAGVPPALALSLNPRLMRMVGTDGDPCRCGALQGEIGVAVGCAIYGERPSPCREFNPLAQFGEGDEACRRARQKHGLPPLPALADWV